MDTVRPDVLNMLPKYARREFAAKLFGKLFQLHTRDRDYDMNVHIQNNPKDPSFTIILNISPDIVVTIMDYHMPGYVNAGWRVEPRHIVRAEIKVQGLTFITTPDNDDELAMYEESLVCSHCGADLSHKLPPRYFGDCNEKHGELVYSLMRAYTPAVMVQHCILAAMTGRGSKPPAIRSDRFLQSLSSAVNSHARFVLYCIWRHRESILGTLPRDVLKIILRYV
jgi:hypothetical protein